jgi:hypothetical protein
LICRSEPSHCAIPDKLKTSPTQRIYVVTA